MITVTHTPQGRRVDMMLGGSYNGPRYGLLTVEGLVEGPNAIPYGLPFAPGSLSFRPGAAGLWGETQVPDATNLYITVGSGGATSGRIDYEEW